MVQTYVVKVERNTGTTNIGVGKMNHDHTKEICGTCVYWQQKGNTGKGICWCLKNRSMNFFDVLEYNDSCNWWQQKMKGENE